MLPVDCPAWDYEQFPGYDAKVGTCCNKFLVALRRGEIDCEKTSRDTRDAHGEMFHGLTAPGTAYYAGHYRGEKLRCLEFYEVEIASDPRVGVPAQRVDFDMANLADHILRAGFSAVEKGCALPDSQVPAEDKLYYVVVFACRVLVEFLRIHPYANGNGHMGRFIVWMILVKFGYWPNRWPLNDSPPYHELIRQYRDGDSSQLEIFVLTSVLPR